MISNTEIEKKVDFSVKDLFNIGAHLGHRSSVWNPRMSSYIYGTKDKTHIIDLDKTHGLMKTALDFLFGVAKNRGKVLFVGTRPKERDMVSEYATYCSQFFINYRWLGGTLTNWSVIYKAINKINYLDKLIGSKDFEHSYTKKERISFEKLRNKLLVYLGGINKMRKVPDAVIVLDAIKDRTAILEANKMNIPVIAILDTNADPSGVNYPIPANDDSLKCIKLYLQLFTSSILAGMKTTLKDK